MKRRSFTTRRRAFMLSATAGLFVPVKARAQKRRRIGALIPGSTSAVFRDRLRTFGWSESTNLEIIVRSTGGDARKVPALADALLTVGVELVIAIDTPSAQALFQRTKTVPIIIAGIGDPVAAGLVSSLARPSGNVTGWLPTLTHSRASSLSFRASSCRAFAALPSCLTRRIRDLRGVFTYLRHWRQQSALS